MSLSSKHEILKNAFFQPKADDSIDKLESIKGIVFGPAYADFSPRNNKGVKKGTIENALDTLSEKLFNYFHNGKTETESKFNEWHKEICSEFCKNFNKLSKGKPIKFGKAQKIVNMSFKYLYCFSDSQNFSNKFVHCHMPLDSYTLEWFIEKIVLPYNEDKMKKDRISATKIRDTSWSKLESGDESTNYSYAWIQNKIREYLNGKNNCSYVDENGNKLSPFIAEFFIWPEQKWKTACKALLSQSIIGDNYPRFSTPELYESIEGMKQLTENLYKKFINSQNK